ncbi:MAG: PEP-CTERM sorting domain-containing protein [Armatimonadetes bacterium]|nr:PEP-CTERM sorting domain-containing protein [Armatimonadota bacterium]
MKKLSLVALGLLSASAFSQFQINELFVNPSGTDGGWEFMEIKGTPGASLAGMYFISMEGDIGGGAGSADVVVDLGATLGSLGSNGLAMIRWGDSVSPLEAETTLDTESTSSSGALENGSNSFLLTSGFAPVQGTDYDADDDGVLDNGFGTIIDGVGWTDGGASDITYGLLNYTNGTVGTFTPDAFSRLPGDGVIVGDVSSGTGITDFDQTKVAFYSAYRGPHPDGTSRDEDWEDWANSGYATFPEDAKVLHQTPGGVNPVPEPATFAIIGIGLAGIVARRRG